MQDISLQMYGVMEDSIVDGPGLRYAVFLQGCPHHCPGCHNETSQSFDGGYTQTVDEVFAQITAAKLTQGVTFSGGEPFAQCEGLYELVKRVHEAGYNIWVYSGYLYEDLMAGNPHELAPKILELCDVLVDGPFIQVLNSYELKWKGSSNQRVIDLNKTRSSGSIILWSQNNLPFEKPTSW